MHNPDPVSRIREPFGLIPPVAGDRGGAGPEDPDGRQDEQRDTPNRVLVVEDEFLLSAVLTSDLQASGYEVIGPFATLTSAMEAVESESFDGAILDINLKGELVYPLAEELARRGIPFLFLSGYETTNLPEALRSHARLAKPADPAALLRAVKIMLGAAS